MTTHGGRKVAIILMKSDEADATIDVLERERPDVEVTDRGTYWHIAADNEIVVSMEKVGQELGQSIALSQWLVIMSSFVGRAAPGEDFFRVTSKMVELEAGA
jgi:methane monooxygenase regulatory protein B